MYNREYITSISILEEYVSNITKLMRLIEKTKRMLENVEVETNSEFLYNLVNNELKTQLNDLNKTYYDLSQFSMKLYENGNEIYRELYEEGLENEEN